MSSATARNCDRLDMSTSAMMRSESKYLNSCRDGAEGASELEFISGLPCCTVPMAVLSQSQPGCLP